MYVYFLYVCILSICMYTLYMYVYSLYVCILSICMYILYIYVYSLYICILSICMYTLYMYVHFLYVCILSIHTLESIHTLCTTHIRGVLLQIVVLELICTTHRVCVQCILCKFSLSLSLSLSVKRERECMCMDVCARSVCVLRVVYVCSV